MDARAPHLDSLNMNSKHPCWTAHIGFETLLVYNAVYLPLSTVDRRPPSLPSIPPSTSSSSSSFSSSSFSFSFCQCHHHEYIDCIILRLNFKLLFLSHSLTPLTLSSLIFVTIEMFSYKTYVQRSDMVLLRKFYFKLLKKNTLQVLHNGFEAIRICQLTFCTNKLLLCVTFVLKIFAHFLTHIS